MHAASALVLAFAVAASAQTPTPESVGTVTGHILCDDTQQPARFADVRLVPTNVSSADPNVYADLYGGELSPTQTDMNGDYTISNVHPGTYYLRVDYAGYLTPILSFRQDQLSKPTLDVQKRIADELKTVNVAPHATTRADTTVLLGASISGTVFYDDGSPAIGIGIGVFRRNAKGEFKDSFIGTHLSTQFTDAHGRFSIVSLPTDSYLIEAGFTFTRTVVETIPTPGRNHGTTQVSGARIVFSLPLYYGNVFRLKDAEAIKADAGHDTPSVNLTLPLSKLHSVSGTIVAKDGHIVNAGTVLLLYPDTREALTGVFIDRDDNQFHLLDVPEGNYLLEVQEASDVTQIAVPYPAGSNPKTHLEDKTLHTYGTVEQPLIVTGEVPSILITVPEKAAVSTPSTSSP